MGFAGFDSRRHRKEVPMNADGARFFGGDAPEVLCIVQLAIAAEGHGMRETVVPISRMDTPRSKSAANKTEVSSPLQAIEKLGAS